MFKDVLRSMVQWVDTSTEPPLFGDDRDFKIEWFRVLPLLILHLSFFLVFFVEFSLFALMTAVFLYGIRMFAITAFYHRYFSHRSYKTSRWFQFIFAVIGNSSCQRGPLWWAAHHRNHHRMSEKSEDLHSPTKHGFWMSHIFWFTTRLGFKTHFEKITDFKKFPELVFLNRFDTLVPFLLAFCLITLGEILKHVYPHWNVTGFSLFVWGFIVSTVVLMHATFTINSLSHMFGKRRYNTSDDSRNNWFLAIITFGEGWHNNHHFYPHSVAQGFKSYEIDITYQVLKVFKKLGLVWDLKEVPDHVLSLPKASLGQSPENKPLGQAS